MIVAVLQCKCGHKTLLHDSTLRDIETSRRGSPKGERYAVVLCPKCARATQFQTTSVPRVPSREVLQVTHLKTIDLALVTLRCAGKNCAAHIKVHVLRDTNPAGVRNWKLGGVTCYENNDPRIPP